MKPGSMWQIEPGPKWQMESGSKWHMEPSPILQFEPGSMYQIYELVSLRTAGLKSRKYWYKILCATLETGAGYD